MKTSIVGILFTLALLASCRPPMVCGFATLNNYEFQGAGFESELTKLETIGIMDTVVAAVNIKVVTIDEEEDQIIEGKGIGVTILIKEQGKEDHKIGGVSDIHGQYKTYVEPGTYDIEFLYSFFNTLVVKNVPFQSGELKEIQVKLGRRGAEEKVYTIDIK